MVIRPADDTATIIANTCNAVSMTDILMDARAGPNVPEFDETVTGARDNVISIELNAIHRTTVALDDVEERAGFEVPYPNGGVLGAAYNIAFVELNTRDPPSMTLRQDK